MEPNVTLQTLKTPENPYTHPIAIPYKSLYSCWPKGIAGFAHENRYKTNDKPTQNL